MNIIFYSQVSTIKQRLHNLDNNNVHVKYYINALNPINAYQIFIK